MFAFFGGRGFFSLFVLHDQYVIHLSLEKMLFSKKHENILPFSFYGTKLRTERMTTVCLSWLMAKRSYIYLNCDVYCTADEVQYRQTLYYIVDKRIMEYIIQWGKWNRLTNNSGENRSFSKAILCGSLWWNCSQCLFFWITIIKLQEYNVNLIWIDLTAISTLQ